MRTLVPLWETYWYLARKKKSEKTQRAGILPVLAKCFWPTFLLGALYQLVYVLLQFASPQILGLIIKFVQSDEGKDWQGYLYTAMFAVVAFLSAISDSSYWYNMRLVGLRLKTVLSSTIYRKSLRLSNGARKTQTGTTRTTIKVTLLVHGLVGFKAQIFASLCSFVGFLTFKQS